MSGTILPAARGILHHLDEPTVLYLSTVSWRKSASLGCRPSRSKRVKERPFTKVSRPGSPWAHSSWPVQALGPGGVG